MPRVPTVNGDQVRERGIGQQRTSFAQPAIQQSNQIAAAQGNLINRASQTGGELLTLADTYRRRANEQNVAQRTAEFSDSAFQILNDSESGLLNTKGENSFESRENFENRINELRESFGDKIHGNSQQQAFDRNIDRIYRKGVSQIERHTAAERTKFDRSNHNSIISNSQNVDLRTALSDADLNDEITIQRQNIVSFAERNGLSEQQAAEEIFDSNSKTYSNAILQIIDAGNPVLAERKLAQFGEFIDPKSKKALRSAVKEGSNRSKGSFAADKIISQSDDLSDALDRVSRINDTEVRDIARSRVNKYFSDRKRADKQRSDSRFLGALNQIEEIPAEQRTSSARETVPASVWQNLSPAERKTLQNSYQIPSKTNESKFIEFNTLTDAELAKIPPAEFNKKYRSRFNDADRRRADNKYSKAIKDARESAANGGSRSFANSSTVNFTKQVEQSLKKFGFLDEDDRTSKLKESKAKLFRVAQDRSEELIGIEEQNLKRKLNPTEKRKIIESILAKDFVAKQDNFFLDSKEEVSELDLLTNEDLIQESVTVPFDRIPKKDVSSIISRFKAKGINNPSKAQIQKVYLKVRRGNNATR